MQPLAPYLVGSAFVLALALNTTPAKAYPFKLDPSSFEEFMNTIEWESGSTVQFTNLQDCEESSSDEIRYYKCKSGFARITNPQGTRVCELRPPEGLVWANIYDIAVFFRSDGKYGYYTYERGCRWVADPPQQEQPSTEILPELESPARPDFTPPPTQDNQTTPQETLEKPFPVGVLIAMAVAFLAVGNGVGILLGFALAKREAKKQMDKQLEPNDQDTL